MHLPDEWFMIEGVADEKPFLIRGREDMNFFREAGEHAIRIDIVFQYNSPDDSGMPDDAQLDSMKEVEDALVEELESDNQGILAFVYTGNKHRVWYWYCKDVGETGQRINKALSAFPGRLPLQLHSRPDPDWTAYNDILD